MKTKTVVCIAPKQVVVKEEEVPDVQPGTFLVRAKLSAISTGTELTLVTSDFPPESVWARLANYPLKLGYSHLGEVVAVGEGIDNVKVGDKVVGWKNHSQFVLYRKGEFCMKVPDGVADEAAVFSHSQSSRSTVSAKQRFNLEKASLFSGSVQSASGLLSSQGWLERDPSLALICCPNEGNGQRKRGLISSLTERKIWLKGFRA